MNNLTVPIAPRITVMINGISVGALQFYSEKTVRQLELLRSLGSSENQNLHVGAQEHTVRLRLLIRPKSELAERTPDLHALQNFDLRIDTPDRVICFASCEYLSLETSCEVGGSIVCEAVIHALKRTTQEVQA